MASQRRGFSPMVFPFVMVQKWILGDSERSFFSGECAKMRVPW